MRKVHLQFCQPDFRKMKWITQIDDHLLGLGDSLLETAIPFVFVIAKQSDELLIK